MNTLIQDVNYLKLVAINQGFNSDIIEKAGGIFNNFNNTCTLLLIANDKPDNVLFLPHYS